jgi:hypothetical protein
VRSLCRNTAAFIKVCRRSTVRKHHTRGALRNPALYARQQRIVVFSSTLMAADSNVGVRSSPQPTPLPQRTRCLFDRSTVGWGEERTPTTRKLKHPRTIPTLKHGNNQLTCPPVLPLPLKPTPKKTTHNRPATNPSTATFQPIISTAGRDLTQPHHFNFSTCSCVLAY